MPNLFQRCIASKYLNLGFRIAVISVLSIVLYLELTDKQNLPRIWQAFRQQMAGASLGWLMLVLILMPFNWLAETQKWRQFVSRYQPLSQWRALRAVLAGVAFSLFTPNRVGEYGGRILLIQSENHWKAILATLVGNFAQFMVLLTAGAAGAMWMLTKYANLSAVYLVGFALVMSLALGMMFFIFFNIRRVIPMARKIAFLHRFKRFAKDIRVLEHFNRRELSGILKWASIRYGIYATQYFLLLKFFDIKTSLLDGYAGISTIFLLQTSIPLPPVAGLVARGNLAMQVWGKVGANEVSSLAATFVLWIINLILPALVGTFSLLYVNIAKTFVYENDKH